MYSKVMIYKRMCIYIYWIILIIYVKNTFVPLYSQNNLQCLLDCFNLWQGVISGKMSEFQGSSSQLFDPKGNNGALVSNMPRWDSHCSSVCCERSEKEASGDYFTEIWSEATKFLELHDVWFRNLKLQDVWMALERGFILGQLLPRYFNMVCLPDCNSPLGSSILFCAFSIPTV